MTWRRLCEKTGSNAAIAASAALAVSSVMVASAVVRVARLWPPAFEPRVTLARVIPDGPWGVPWDSIAAPPSSYQAEALASLAGAIGQLALGCLIIAVFSLVLHTAGKVLASWRSLTIRCALGAQLGDVVRLMSRELLPSGLVGCAAGAVLGTIVLALLAGTWPALLAKVPLALPALLGAVTAALAALAIVMLVTLPLLAHLQRRLRAVADLTGSNVTERGVVLLAQEALVVLQLAGLLVVAYGGALLARGSSLFDAQRPVPYSDSAAIAALRVDPAGAPAARAAVYQQLLAAGRERDTPLVAVTSPGAWLGFGKKTSLVSFCFCSIGGFLRPVVTTTARTVAVSPGALGLMAVELLGGREFAPSDTLGAPRGVILSDIAAAQMFGSPHAIGQTVRMSLLPGGDYRVIGIARSPAPPGMGAGGSALPMAYVAILQHPPAQAEVAGRAGARARLAASGWPARAMPTGSAAVMGAPALLADELRASEAPIAWFGAMALLLAAVALLVALYALVIVMSRTVESRRREIAIRLALGAQREDIWRWVGVRSLALTLTGALGGMGLARWVGTLLREHVRGFAGDDIVLLLGMVLAFGGLAFLASLGPARRAMRVEPAAAWSESRGN